MSRVFVKTSAFSPENKDNLLPVSFFVVLFLFVLVLLYVLFSLFSFILRSWQFLLTLLLRPHLHGS